MARLEGTSRQLTGTAASTGELADKQQSAAPFGALVATVSKGFSNCKPEPSAQVLVGPERRMCLVRAGAIPQEGK